jgi:hypothetical protein
MFEESLPDAELLSRAIKASGLSVRRFARERLVREPRTVWRWLQGPVYAEDGSLTSSNALPRAVRETLEVYLVQHPLPPDADDSTPIEEEEE